MFTNARTREMVFPPLLEFPGRALEPDENTMYVSVSRQEGKRSMRDLSMEDMWHLSPETTADRTVITVRNDRSLRGRIGHSAVRSK